LFIALAVSLHVRQIKAAASTLVEPLFTLWQQRALTLRDGTISWLNMGDESCPSIKPGFSR
jgi:hypothetical protein